ncbi:S8 family peptidase [Robinsoniella sp. KNHs210]|uniref:S8 family peptidase n=1 Tax=Robinsoniella sp. KNHs210 TaxID=1469950 RepID=UPI00047F777E|nr:S8 family peptidase [Robinsoniella sp. KNHs210]
MSEKNLPIKVVLQKATDTQKNNNGGGIKYFGDVTPELQNEIAGKFEDLLEYYSDIFAENELIPAVGKVTVKPEAIAKSHKPNDLCRNCPIIGSEDLDEIYIKVNKKTITETIELIQNPPSQKFRANLTTITDIEPVRAQEKISCSLVQMQEQGEFDKVKKKIKLKLFDFDNEFDNNQILGYISDKLSQYGLSKRNEMICYGEKIRYIKVEVNTFEEIEKIAAINGVKSVDFFQEYSLPLAENNNTDLNAYLDGEFSDSMLQIGIIDGGISEDNMFLKPYIVAKEEYVNPVYQNPSHATFIASTIQYGNKLNCVDTTEFPRFKFVDIIAIPNGDKNFGPVDSIGEEELMEIIEDVMDKYSVTTKIWNLSLGIENKVCDGSMSDLGIFLDYIQDKYSVQIFVSSGNLSQLPLREWPVQTSMGERDRIISPADSVRAITVGSVALFEAADSIVRKNEPSPFSRRGPGANYIVKPDVVDYGGNLLRTLEIKGVGMKGLDNQGKIIEGNGTSYSTPRIVQKYASIYDEMIEKDLLLAKAMLIHSARMNSRELLEKNQNNIKYYGFGVPSVKVQDILQCSEDEVTLVFKQKVTQGSHLEMFDFPYPKTLIYDGKCHGEIGMTLAYNPLLDERYGREYCRVNIDTSFGIYKYDEDKKIKFKGCVPLENAWDEKYEKSRVINGFKWSPIKSYYRKIGKQGIDAGDGWKIRIDMSPRNGLIIAPQEFVLIVTIKDPDGNDIYSEVVNGLREKGYITNNLETRQQIRQRQ